MTYLRNVWPPVGIGLLALALLVGGAGLGYPLLNLTVYLAALYVLVRFALAGGWRDLSAPAWAVAAIAAAFIALALLQLIPLPASLWQALPGRSGVASLYAVLGWQDRWLPLSLTPDLTLRFAVSILVPLAVFLAVQRLDRGGRLLALRWIVAIALVSSLIAAIQVAMGAGALVLYETSHRGSGVGFFVNRNHHAVLLLVALMLAAVPGVVPQFGGAQAGRRRAGKRSGDAAAGAGIFTALIVVGVLALGVLSTGSRTALVALPFALLIAVALLAGRLVRKYLMMVAGGYLLLALIVIQSDLFTRVLARFAWLRDDFRFQYWDNSLFALKDLLPWGSGFGSFGAIYPTVEPLAQVTPLRVNHAHNDLIELVMEGGIPALVLMLGAIVTGGILFWRALQDRQQDGRAQVIAAGAGIGVIIGFSLVDFPLRMEAVAALFGALIAMFIRPNTAVGAKSVVTASGAKRVVAIVPAICVALVAGAMQLGSALERSGQYAAAVKVAPWSASAWQALATQEQLAGNMDAAREAAVHVLNIAPMNAGGVRAHGVADIALGDAQRGTDLLAHGASLGWQDIPLQMWLIDAGIASDQPQLAAERIDALLRRDMLGEALLKKLRTLIQIPGGSRAIAERLADRPGWRQGFLNAVAKDMPGASPEVLALLDHLNTLGQGADAAESWLIRWKLADAKAYSNVRDVWLRSGGKGLVADGEFEHLEAPLPNAGPPYSWRAPRVAGVYVAPLQDGGRSGDALSVRSNGLTGGVVLAQQIVLQPGRYQLRVAVQGKEDGGETIRPKWRVSCVSGERIAEIQSKSAKASADQWRWINGDFTVAPNCLAQEIQLFLPPGSGRPLLYRIDALSLKRLHSGIAADRR